MKSDLCPLCGNANISESFKAQEFLFKSKKYSYFQCNECSHIFVSPTPDEKTLEAFYIKAIAKLRKLFPLPENFSTKYLSDAYSEKEKVELLTEKGFLGKKGRILDIGFGRGGFLIALNEKGWDCSGVEFTDEVSLLPGVEGKFKIFYGKKAFETVADNDYDLVTLWHVLEHLSEPVEVLKSARKTLCDDGKIIVAIPNFDSFSRQIFKENWYGAIPPWHLQQFTPRSVSYAFAQAGLIAKEIYGFGRMEQSIIWIESFTLKMEAISESSFPSVKRFFLRLIRRSVSLSFPLVLKAETLFGKPSAIIVIGEKNPLVED